MGKYIVEDVCKNDDTVLNDTRPLDASELSDNWTMIVMSSGFSTPRCPTCKYKTFSDLNIGTKKRIKQVDTGEYVEFETVKREATDLATESLTSKKARASDVS